MHLQQSLRFTAVRTFRAGSFGGQRYLEGASCSCACGPLSSTPTQIRRKRKRGGLGSSKGAGMGTGNLGVSSSIQSDWSSQPERNGDNVSHVPRASGSFSTNPRASVRVQTAVFEYFPAIPSPGADQATAKESIGARGSLGLRCHSGLVRSD